MLLMTPNPKTIEASAVPSPRKREARGQRAIPSFSKALLFVLAILLLAPFPVPGRAEPQNKDAGLRIDVPVPLKETKIVLNLDHLAFTGDQFTGLAAMTSIVQSYKAAGVPIRIVAVFHGPAGYIILNDGAYNATRKSWHGNPFRSQIEALQREGVQFELCVNTAQKNSWVNSDLLPGVKVNAGANLRLIQLVQEGYVQLHP